MARLENKRALVTGAGSDGIGRAIVRAYRREGAHVAAHYYRDPLPPELASEFGRGTGSIVQIRADFAEPAAARAVVDRAVEQLGGLDIVVANAAMMNRIPFLEITDAEFETLINVNLNAVFALVQQAAKHMVTRSIRGRIIIVSSVNQDAVVHEQSHYCASKGGLRQLARAAALELGPHGINVNLLVPGATLTDMVRDRHADSGWVQSVAAKHSLGRIGKPEDFEGAALFLASEDSAFITGTSVVVDGGLTLSH